MKTRKNLGKGLALVIMLAMVLTILPFSAAATNTPVYVRFFDGVDMLGDPVLVTASDDTAYSAILAGIQEQMNEGYIGEYIINRYGIQSINFISPGVTVSDDSAWLYAVDDVLSDKAIGEMTVSAYSVITVFYVEDQATTRYAYILPDGAATSGNAIAANANDTIKYRVAISTVDLDDLYSTILSTGYTTQISASTTDISIDLTAVPALSNYTVVPAYKRVVGSTNAILASWLSDTSDAYDDLTSTQQGLIDSDVVDDGTDPNATMTEVNALAYEVAPYTRANSAALNRLVFTQGNEHLSIKQTVSGKRLFDPSITAYTLETVSSGFTVAGTPLASGATVSYTSSDNTNMPVTSASVVSFDEDAPGGNYTLTITVNKTLDNNATVTKNYTVVIPFAEAASGGSVPADVCGFLPVGQFAMGQGWGGLGVDEYGTNSSVTMSDPSTKKFVYGYESTGVSLGMLGGFVQFDMGSTYFIEDNPNNPYGIDFIIYGNPFSGNPEAGSVMVSEDGEVWYNLAGSLHYDNDTDWNVNVTYLKVPEQLTFGNTTLNQGLYYSTNYDPAIGVSQDGVQTFEEAIDNATWTFVRSNLGWWPEYDYEDYGGVWSDGDLCAYGTVPDTGDVYWRRDDSFVEVDPEEDPVYVEAITYCGVTRVKDDAEFNLSGANATNYYLFGYADIRSGGNYGTAVNPYASLPSTGGGGDGFDLAWAVNTEGKPVNMTGKQIRYVRVYSAVLYDAGIFGETSTEVCGLYVANSANQSVLTSNGPTKVIFKKIGANNSITIAQNQIPSNGGTINRISAIRGLANGDTYLSVTVNAASGAIVYVNGVLLTEESSGTFTGTIPTPGSDKKIRVLVQDGSKAPYLFVII